MKLTTLPILIASALLAQVASAQSSSTPIIGYYKFDVPTGTSILSAGFVKKKDFQGAMSGIVPGAASKITGAGFPSFTAVPSYAEILSGPHAGTVLDILSNTATEIEVDAELGAAGLNLAGNETFCVRAHNTLGSVFQGGGGFNAGTDSVTLYGELTSETYTHNGSNWEDGGANDADGVIIYPGQAFIVDHADEEGDPVTITVGGGSVSYVKYGPTKVSLYPGVPNLVGLVNPLVAKNPSDPAYAGSRNQLGDYGFVASLVAGNDTVDHYSFGTFVSPGSYTSNGSFMEDGGANDVSTELVTNGAGLVVGVPVDGIYTAPQLHPNP